MIFRAVGVARRRAGASTMRFIAERDIRRANTVTCQSRSRRRPPESCAMDRRAFPILAAANARRARKRQHMVSGVHQRAEQRRVRLTQKSRVLNGSTPGFVCASTTATSRTIRASESNHVAWLPTTHRAQTSRHSGQNGPCSRPPPFCRRGGSPTIQRRRS